MTRVAAMSGPISPGGTGRVDKPWGYEIRWAVTERYAGKIIHIDRGHQLSLQYHVQKEESIHVLSGVMDLLLESNSGEVEVHRLTAGMSAHIRPGRKHRFIAAENTDLVEVSSPEIDDVVRLEDSYGRAGTSAP
jgi:mannose-6-phosphate isomerase